MRICCPRSLELPLYRNRKGGGGGHSKAAAMKSHLREVEIPFIDRLSLFSVGQNGAKTSSEVEAQQDLDKSCYCRVAE